MLNWVALTQQSSLRHGIEHDEVKFRHLLIVLTQRHRQDRDKVKILWPKIGTVTKLTVTKRDIIHPRFFSLIRKRTRNKFQRRKWKRDENVFFWKEMIPQFFDQFIFRWNEVFFSFLHLKERMKKTFFSLQLWRRRGNTGIKFANIFQTSVLSKKWQKSGNKCFLCVLPVLPQNAF